MMYNQNKETWYISDGLRHPPIVCEICSLSQLAASELKYQNYQNYPAPIIEVYFFPTIRLRGFNYVGRSKSLLTTSVMDWYILH